MMNTNNINNNTFDILSLINYIIYLNMNIEIE